MPASKYILIVDDHVEMGRLLRDQLQDAGYEVEVTTGGAEALERARLRLPDLALTDLRMKDVDGLDVLDGLHALEPGMPVLIMTAFGAVDSAVEAIKRGAYHYLTKPFPLSEVLLYIERALKDRQMRDENRSLRRLAAEQSSLDSMIGRSPSMMDLFRLVERAGPTTVPVLLRGESGSGKELVAKALHFRSDRRERPFIPVNCRALPESLLESELFGHMRGAFSGATTARRGLFLEAEGGTLFLDEIGDMSPGLQARLLRAIEHGEVRPVGSDGTRQTDVRIIAATHQDLEDQVQQGHFRADLFFRLNVLPIAIPSLRDRAEDIPLLIEHFLARVTRRNHACTLKRFSPEVVARLTTYPWPGNVRELENLVTRLAIVLTREEADLFDLRAQAPEMLAETEPLERARRHLVPLRQLENEYIAWVIAQCGGNKTRAAEILKIDVSTIYRRDL